MDDVRRAAFANWIWAGLQSVLAIGMIAALPVPIAYAIPLVVSATALTLAGFLTYRRRAAGPILAMIIFGLMGVSGIVTGLLGGKLGGTWMAVALAAVLANMSYKALVELRRAP